FQDTDRTQARIIDRLARDASGGYVAGKTIVVGDPKQSIYGFRRADPEMYYGMTEKLARGGAERRVITDQYRSDPPLLDAINAMFARLFPAEERHDPNVFRPAYNALTPRANMRRELDARITMLHAQHEEKSDRWFAEAEALAQWILANRDGSALDLQRFAILFRRLTRLDDYLDTLDRHGIAYVLPPTRMFLDRRAPVDLLAVLRAIAYPFDRGAQISAARSPYFALTDVEIARGVIAEREAANNAVILSREDGEGPPSDSASVVEPQGVLRSAQDDTWATFAGAIADFREAARHITISALIDLVVETTGIERVYDAAADGVRHLRHLEHVRAIAFDYDQRHGGSVRQFVDEIARRREEPEEMEPSLVDESQNAVRILSVHAAKGLEFDTVILPDLAFPTSTSDALQLFTVEQPKSIVLAGRAESISANFRFAGDEKLKKLSGKRDEAETRRLFYVAVTRAKTDVVFVCNVHEETKNIGFLKCLTEAIGIDRKELPSLWPASGREVRQTEVGPIAFELAGTGSAHPVARTRKRLHDSALESKLAGSDIVPIDIPSPGSTGAPLSVAEVAALRAGSRNRAAGTLLHRVLELWDGRSDLEPLLRQLAVEAGADADSVTRVRKRLAVIARSPFLQRIAVAETVGREVPVRFVENGTVVERRIDRLLREPDSDLVIDYKSGSAHPDRIKRDREQVARYCAAVAAITGRPCSGVLWYIDVDGAQDVPV
ncbi:MAG TPA: 3'-5' exonuclease, partial [Thermoanaerobaculia bacterium]|nr:3'-5' exonuclease [Thermoanaerobaculia bacterium]